MTAMFPRLCGECGSGYLTKIERQRWCSKVCGNNWRRRKADEEKNRNTISLANKVRAAKGGI